MSANAPNTNPNTNPNPNPNLVLVAVCLCQAMVVLDASVVNIALPSIDHALRFSAGDLSWVVNAYTLAFGGLLLLGGRLADLLGHRRAMLWGLAVFGAASLAGGLAQDPGQLIAARAGQGVAAAVLAPVSLTVIMVTFPEGPARRRAISLWAMVAAAGSAVGVLLGGLLTDLLDWRWVLFVNVPIVVVTLAVAVRVVHDTRERGPRRLDLTGAALVTAAPTLLAFGTLRAGDHGWSDQVTLTTLALAAVIAAVFVIWELRVAESPLLRIGVLRTRSVWVADVLVLFIGAATIGGFYFASLFLQNVLGFDPWEAGLAFLPFCVGIVLGAALSTRVAERTGYRATIAGGLGLGSVGMFLFSLMDADTSFASGFVLPSLVASTGIGLAMVANTTLGTSNVDPAEAGLVSGLLNSSRQLGGSVALAGFTSLAVSVARRSDSSGTLDATVHGYQAAFMASGGVVLAAALVAVLFVPLRRQAVG